MAKKTLPEVKADEVKAVTVKVLCSALGEGDETYLKGQSFETTAERAAALGDSVEIIGSLSSLE